MDADRAAGDQLAGGDSARPSDACEDFIKAWESCELYPYTDQAGIWTVGYGHVLQPMDPRIPITGPEADALFYGDLFTVADGVSRLITVPVSQCQFDALSSFCFNAGVGSLAVSSMRRLINTGDAAHAGPWFEQWNKVTVNGLLVASAGLLKRRQAERAMYESGDYSGRP